MLVGEVLGELVRRQVVYCSPKQACCSDSFIPSRESCKFKNRLITKTPIRVGWARLNKAAGKQCVPLSVPHGENSLCVCLRTGGRDSAMAKILYSARELLMDRLLSYYPRIWTVKH